MLAAATEIAGVHKAGDLIIVESTSPVGTTEQVRNLVAGLRPDLRLPGRTTETPDVAIAYCPERVLPGRILEELILRKGLPPSWTTAHGPVALWAGRLVVQSQIPEFGVQARISFAVVRVPA